LNIESHGWVGLAFASGGPLTWMERQQAKLKLASHGKLDFG